MPTYQVRGKRRDNGQQAKGTVGASSEQEARQIAARKLIVEHVQLLVPASSVAVPPPVPQPELQTIPTRRPIEEIPKTAQSTRLRRDPPPGQMREATVWEGSPSQWCNFTTYIFAGLFFWLIFPPIIAILSYYSVRFTRYELTTERLRITTGVFSRHLEELELYRVKDTSVIQPFIQRMMGLGRVVVITSDRTMSQVVLDSIFQPMEVREMIRRHTEYMRDRKRVREVDYE